MAVRFNASGQEYTRTASLGAISSFSVTCWLKIAVDQNDTSGIWSLDDGNSGGFDNAYLATDTDGTTLQFIESSASVFGSRALTVGTWYYAGVSVNGANGTMITRALGDTSSTVTTWAFGAATVTATNWRIGKPVYAARWLNGSVAAVKFWTATLTQAELENEAWSYLPRRTTNLRAWHPLLTPETVDYSGGGFTLSGGAGTAKEDGPGISWGPRRIILPPAPPIVIQLNDTGAASEALAVAGSVPLAQAASGGDTVTVAATAPGADAGSAAQSLVVTASIALADSASAVESISVGVQKTPTDTASAVDVLAAQATTPLTQTGTAADALAAVAGLGLAEAASASDALVASPVSFKTLTDGAAAADTLAATILRNLGPAYPPRRVWSAGQPTRYPAG